MTQKRHVYSWVKIRRTQRELPLCPIEIWITDAALKNRHRQFAIDGEAVVLGVDGVADFEAWREHQAWSVQKYRRLDRGERMPAD